MDSMESQEIKKMMEAFLACINSPLYSDKEKENAAVFNRLVEEYSVKLGYDCSETLIIYLSEMGIPAERAAADIARIRKIES